MNTTEVDFSKNWNRPSVVRNVVFLGIERTKLDALLKETGAIIEKSSTFGQIIINCQKAASHMQEVGLVEYASPIIDAAKNSEGGSASFDVIMDCREYKAINARAEAAVDNRGEGQGLLTVGKSSAFGRGETVSFNTTKGHRGTTLFNANFSKPFLGWQRYANRGLDCYRHFNHHNASHFSGLENGIRAYIQQTLPRLNLENKLSWDLSFRHIQAEKIATFSVREHAGHSMRSAIRHVIEYNTEEPNSALPAKGVLCRVSNGYAGFAGMGDAHNAESNAQLRLSAPLFGGFILSGSLWHTFIKQLSGRHLSLLDRCYLGGPTSLRGFLPDAVGPCDGTDFLGGRANFSAALHLYKKLLPQGLYLHGFVNAGSVLSTEETFDNPADYVSKLRRDLRSSMGIGLVFPLMGWLRLELNYAHPFQIQQGDLIPGRLQFGVGIDFV